MATTTRYKSSSLIIGVVKMPGRGKRGKGQGDEKTNAAEARQKRKRRGEAKETPIGQRTAKGREVKRLQAADPRTRNIYGA